MLKKIIKTIVPVVFCASLGTFFRLISPKNNLNYENVFLSPPKEVFPVVWTLIYILIAISAYKFYSAPQFEETQQKGMIIFYLDLVFNAFWNLFFFTLGNKVFALIWLFALYFIAVSHFVTFKKVDKTSAYLLVPYLVWLVFATYLNFALVIK